MPRNPLVPAWGTYRPPEPRPARTRLSRVQKELLKYIIYYVDRWGIQPTLIQMGKHFGSDRHDWARPHLWALLRKGFLGRPESGFHGMKIYRRPNGDVYYRGARPFGGPLDRPRPPVEPDADRPGRRD